MTMLQHQIDEFYATLAERDATYYEAMAGGLGKPRPRCYGVPLRSMQEIIFEQERHYSAKEGRKMDPISAGKEHEKRMQKKWKTEGRTKDVAGGEVDRRARQLLKQGKVKSYEGALTLIKRDDPKLWNRYLMGGAR
jgi:hypothetical protein